MNYLDFLRRERVPTRSPGRGLGAAGFRSAKTAQHDSPRATMIARGVRSGRADLLVQQRNIRR